MPSRPAGARVPEPREMLVRPVVLAPFRQGWAGERQDTGGWEGEGEANVGGGSAGVLGLAARVATDHGRRRNLVLIAAGATGAQSVGGRISAKESSFELVDGTSRVPVAGCGGHMARRDR